MEDKPQDPKGKRRTALQKLRVVLEASELSDEELGAFLRREGLHEAELKKWTVAAMAALHSDPRRLLLPLRGGRRVEPQAGGLDG